jgi:hypothetical protein
MYTVGYFESFDMAMGVLVSLLLGRSDAGIPSILTHPFSRLPETKDRTYEELDVLFEKRISARKFASTTVDADVINEVERVY